MPNFKYSLDGSIPKIFFRVAGKESTEHGLAVKRSRSTPSPRRDGSPPLQMKAVVTGMKQCESTPPSELGSHKSRLSRLAQLRELQRVPMLQP